VKFYALFKVGAGEDVRAPGGRVGVECPIKWAIKYPTNTFGEDICGVL